MRVDMQLLGDKQLIKDLNDFASSSINEVMRSPTGQALQPIRNLASQKYASHGWNDFAKKSNLPREVGTNKRLGVYGRVILEDIESRTVIVEGREVPFNVVANILEFGSEARNIREYAVMRTARDEARDEAIRIFQERAATELERKWQQNRLKYAKLKPKPARGVEVGFHPTEGLTIYGFEASGFVGRDLGGLL
jgi:hypothetical protein